MDFKQMAGKLIAQGYAPKKANAKIAHDIILKSINDSGFHDKITIKGGVVMSGLTDAVRRATIDMDVDFLGYSFAETSIRRFVQKLNISADCDIRIDGPVQELKQHEYKGKRINLVLTDNEGQSIKTKVDIGVHANKSIDQVDFRFNVIDSDDGVVLLVNPNEQIFIEKLKSLLRLGVVSTRYKDVYDLFYLCKHTNRAILRDYMLMCIFEDKDMLENNVGDITNRLEQIFSNKTFLKRMARPDYAWLDESSENVLRRFLTL